MKKVVLAILLMAGTMVVAQQGKHHKGPQEQLKNMTPEQVATLETKKLTLALDLDKKQQTAIKELQLEKINERMARREAMKEKKEEDSNKAPNSAERYEMHSARLDKMIAYKEKMKSILTPTQYENWEKLSLHKRKHHRGKKKSHSRG